MGTDLRMMAALRTAGERGRSRCCRALCVTLGVMGLGSGVACQTEQRQQQAPAVASSSTTAPDRLAEGEHLPGAELTFGIEVPQGMKLAAQFSDVAHVTGTLTVAELATYYKKRVLVSAVEMTPERALFERVYVRGDDSKRLYRIEIASRGASSRVTIRDITPTPAARGLDETQRWERAGYNKDGSLKQRLQLY